MSELNLAAIKARADRAHDELVRLCNDRANWRWSIPADPERDSDLIIGATNSDVLDLIAIVEKVKRYAEDREAYGRRGRTVGSARIASDLFQILGVTRD